MQQKDSSESINIHPADIKKSRYPGVKPFTRDERHIFFGRNNDIVNLCELIDVENLILLFSKSGLGKSSLLQAGVLPRILEERKYSPSIIRFGSYFEGKPDTLVQIATNKISVASQNTFLDTIIANENSMWYHLKSMQIVDKLEHSTSSKFILIFDQFEELFTYPKNQIAEFKKQLGDLLYSKIPQNFRYAISDIEEIAPDFLTPEMLAMLYANIEIKLVIAIRSDKLNLLNEFKDVLPNILRSSYEIKPLTTDQAREAIINPTKIENHIFDSPTFSLRNESIKKIINYLTKNSEKSIESTQLQIVCQHVENQVILRTDGNKDVIIEISPSDLGDLTNIFHNFYLNCIEAIDDEDQRLKAKIFIEDGLIIEGKRVSLDENIIHNKFGIDNEVLRKLTSFYLIRPEQNTTGNLSYELSHDTLIEPIIKEKERRLVLEKQQELQIIQAEELKKLILQKRRQRRVIFFISVLLVIISLFGYFTYNNLKIVERQRNLTDSLRIVLSAEKKKVEKSKQDIVELLKLANQLQNYDTSQSKLAHIYKGLSLFNDGRYHEASRSFDLANSYEIIAETKLMDEWIKKSDSCFILKTSADQLFKSQNYDAASKYYNLLLQLNPADKSVSDQIQKICEIGKNRNIFVPVKISDFEMVSVIGGTFLMGGTVDAEEKPVHMVRVGSFKISKFEITQKIWKKYMRSTPSLNANCDSCPVENVSWNEVQVFITEINKSTNHQYRLPTEAEWEYAARSGNLNQNWIYSGSQNILEVAVFSDNSAGKTHVVGSKKPNALGIYDMSGNVFEWCSDWFQANYYSISPSDFPSGPVQKSGEKVIRGGSYKNVQKLCRVSNRFRKSPDTRMPIIGFRLVEAN